MRWTTKRRDFIIGDKCQFDELKKIILDSKDGKAIEPLIPLDSFSCPVVESIAGGFDLNNDGVDDFLYLISVSVGRDEKRETYSFLGLLNGEKGDGLWPSYDRKKMTKLLAVQKRSGSEPAICDVEVERKKSGCAVKYRVWDGKKYSSKRGKSYKSDDLAQFLFDLEKSIFNHCGYLFAVRGARYNKGAKSRMYVSQTSSGYYNLLSFVYLNLEKTKLKKFPTKFKEIMIEDAKIELILTEKDKTTISSIVSKSGEILTNELNKLKWKGKSLSRAYYYKQLEEMSSHSERKKLADYYCGATLKAYQSKGGLFTILDKLNNLAKKYKYKGYPEFSGKVNYKFDVDDLDRMLEKVRKEKGDELKSIVEQLKILNGGDVYEYDVPFLFKKWLKKETGFKKIPQIPVESALKITRQFYNDIGFDFQKKPIKDNIFHDLYNREDKDRNAFALTLNYGNNVWMNANFHPKTKLAFYDFETIIHEYCHLLHMLTGSVNANGHIAMNAVAAQPQPFVESIAIAMQEQVYEPKFFERYLSHIPIFKDKQKVKAFIKVEKSRMLYERISTIVRSKSEIELYRGANKKGLKPLKEIVEKYLFVKSNINTLDFLSIPHPSAMPIYYPNYSLGYETAQIVSSEVKKAFEGSRPIKNCGNKVRKVFEKAYELKSFAEINKFASKK